MPMDLQFDKMVVDTTLAEKYLKDNDDCTKVNALYDASKAGVPDFILDPQSFDGLANKILESSNLICQLEYLVRQKPLETTKLEINMLIKRLRYQLSQDGDYFNCQKTLVMTSDSPLLDFGCIALAHALQIGAIGKAAPICHMFVKLCHSCGFDLVSFHYVASGLDSFVKNKVLSAGCIGVVTAQSDVDSAVSKFLSALDGDVWGIRRILVQESAVEGFKKAIAWKTRAGGESSFNNELTSRCSDFYVYDGKIYMHEYVGDQSIPQNAVLIEAFRTVKEAMSLIKSYSPFCVSLWSSDVAESNEIAYGINAPLVWINDYGVIGEPAQFSQAYYSQISIRNQRPELPELHELSKLQKDWTKLTLDQRRNKIKNAIKDDQKSDINKLFKKLIASDPKCFAHVASDCMVVGVNKPRDIYFLKWELGDHTLEDFVEHLMNGSGFLIHFPEVIDAKHEKSGKLLTEPNIRSVISHLSSSDLPIQIINHKDSDKFDRFPLAHSTRVVYTSFGTIFAN